MKKVIFLFIYLPLSCFVILAQVGAGNFLCLEAVLSIAIAKSGEEEKLASALHQLKEEDPTLQVSHWKLNNGKMELNVTLPPNTKAIVYIPAKEIENIKESGTLLSSVKGVKVTGEHGSYVAVEAGSGNYQFTAK